MTVIRFFTDPHIGRELKANTTSGSRALLAEQIYQHGRQAASIGQTARYSAKATTAAQPSQTGMAA